MWGLECWLTVVCACVVVDADSVWKTGETKG